MARVRLRLSDFYWQKGSNLKGLLNLKSSTHHQVVEIEEICLCVCLYSSVAS